MAQVKRGRPKANDKKVEVGNVLCEFLTSKENGYNAVICYLKIIDKNLKKKLKPILALENEKVNMPYWRTEKNELILKVKDKFLNITEPCEKGKIYSINIVFESYCIDRENQEPLIGFYCKIPTVTPCGMEVADIDLIEQSD